MAPSRRFKDTVNHSISGRQSEPMLRIMSFRLSPHLPHVNENNRRSTIKCIGHFIVRHCGLQATTKRRSVLQPLVVISRAGLEPQEPRPPRGIWRTLDWRLGFEHRPWVGAQHQEAHHCANVFAALPNSWVLSPRGAKLVKIAGPNSTNPVKRVYYVKS